MDNNELMALYAEQSRRHPEDPWVWQLAHRTMGGRPLLNLHAIAAIMRDPHPFVVIQKSAQVGITEAMVGLALWAADTGYAERGHALFLMPTSDQMADFAQGRFDRAIQDSAYLRARLQPEPPKRKGADNQRLKRIGDGYIYLRGSESPRQVASVDADVMILDEYDQMADGILDLAKRRLSSSRGGLLRIASTPRYPETGVNALFLQSDRHYYFLPCPACGYAQVLNFEDNVDRERMMIVCCDCRTPMDVLALGSWRATAPGNSIRGYHLSRLYSPWLSVRELVEASEHTTLSAIQQFQNSDLGEIFSPPGGSLALADLDGARGNFLLSQYDGRPCSMGVDVGARLHVVIRDLPERPTRLQGAAPMSAPRRLWFAGEVRAFEELDALMGRFNVKHCVVDGQPEGHAARAFAARHQMKVRLAQYHQAAGHERVSGTPRRYLINRVEALDEVFDAFKRREALLPSNARELGGRVRDGVGEYYREVLVPVRTLDRDANGNWVSRYIDNNKADHYAHAEVYCLMASKVPPRAVVSVSGSRRTSKPPPLSSYMASPIVDQKWGGNHGRRHEGGPTPAE